MFGIFCFRISWYASGCLALTSAFTECNVTGYLVESNQKFKRWHPEAAPHIMECIDIYTSAATSVSTGELRLAAGTRFTLANVGARVATYSHVTECGILRHQC